MLQTSRRLILAGIHPVWRSVMLLAMVLSALLLWLASGFSVPLQLVGFSAQLQGFVTIFLGIFIEALPFLFAGVIASSTISLFVSPERVRRLSPRSPVLAALVGAVLGLAFPVCECGSVPTARRLMAKGAPVPLGIAFVLAAPAVNPIVIASTWVAFSRWPLMVVGRIVLTIVIAMAVGLILGLHPQSRTLLVPAGETEGGEDDQCDHHEHSPIAKGRLRAVALHASGEFFEMARYLVLGGLIAATLQTAIPRAALLALGQGPVISVLVLIALAVVLSICSTVDAFVALAFVGSFLPGAILAFLVFGPMVDFKSVLMFTSTFRRRTTALMVLLTLQMVLLAAVVINLYF
ncbi:MAG: permease [Roseiflexaceae bacterium]